MGADFEALQWGDGRIQPDLSLLRESDDAKSDQFEVSSE